MKSLDFQEKIRVSTRLIRCLVLPLAVLLAGISDRAVAVEVPALYQGSTQVTSRDSARERQRAFRDALGQVLIKNTGSTEVINHPVIRRALNNADDYVDTWSYRSVPATPGGDGEEPGIEINVTFFEPEVLSLLDNAEIPLWPRNRPYTLVWVAVQEELGDRQLVGSSSSEFRDVMDTLQAEAARRGLPLLLPVLDFEDRRAIGVEDVWDMNREKLLAASGRYQSESILAIRLVKTLGGEVIGKSSYLFRDQVMALESFEDSEEEFLRDSIDLAARELSAYYAVLLSGTDSNMEVNLTVNGIDSVEDYAGLLDYVGQLTDVNDIHIDSVDQETVKLKLSTGGQLRQLVETIALNRNMTPTGELVRNDNQVYMSYRWNR